MNIRPRNIKKYDGGGYFDNLNNEYFNWYNKLWNENARILGNLPLLKRYDKWKTSNGYDTHHLTDDLKSAAWSNYNYTLASNKNNVRNDILYYLDNSGVNYTSPEDFVLKYNSNIDSIFDTQNRLYNYDMKDSSWTPFNKNYNLTYHSKGSGEGLSTLLYDPTTELYRGTTTHARRPDLYEKEFDNLSDDEKWDRIHKIKLNGKDIYVAKEANGHLRLLPNLDLDSSLNSQTEQNPERKSTGSIKVGGMNNEEKPSFWNQFGKGLKKVAPDVLDALRLGLNLNNNQRVFDTINKSIKPALLQSYHTHRQVVGDEATKLAYYRRAAQGQTKAALPFTSDADRLLAYQMEARRIGDGLRALGDLIDNLEIRRTSEESNQHQWANQERDNRVANSNYLALLDASAKKANLLAQKYSADTSNWDNYLMGILNKYELKKAKELTLQDLIWSLQAQDLIEEDANYKKALLDYRDYVKNNPNIDWVNDSKAADLAKAVRKALRQAMINIYRLRPTYEVDIAKSGTKLTYKLKDDLLYKTARDVVEHFRKMSKMLDDSRIRSKEKPIKLNSYPKNKKARRYLQGGVAPFTVYRPLALGGENTISSQAGGSNGSSKNSNPDKDRLDMIKELFKMVSNNGVPIDANLIYRDMQNFLAKSKAFGDTLSTEDIESMYISMMLKVNNLKFSEGVYKDAKAKATSNDALGTIAVDSYGRYVVLDSESGDIKRVSMELYKENMDKYIPLTNDKLLQLRAYSSNLAFEKGDELMDSVVAQGVGMSKITENIKNLIGTLGTSEKKLEGISEVESNRVKAGMLILSDLSGTPDGHYLITQLSKSQQEQAKAALNYVKNTLPRLLKAILEMNALMNNTTIDNIISDKLLSGMSDSFELTIKPLTGKASDKGLGSGEKGDVSSNPLLAMLREIGGTYLNYSLVTKDSNTKLSVNGTFYSLLPKISEDMSIDKMLSVSGIGGIIQGKRGITFGNLEIKPEDLKHIMYSNDGGMVVTLPCKIVNGIKLVNLDVVETYEKAEQKALQVNSDRNSPQFIQALALELKNEHLDSLLDSNGLPNKNMFGQFLVVDAYTSDKIKFDINSKYVERIENPDEELELRISKALSTDNKKSDYALDVKDHWTMFEGTWDDIYKGTVFIPLNNNPNAALNTWGNSAKIGKTTELEELYLISNKSSKFNGNNTLE